MVTTRQASRLALQNAPVNPSPEGRSETPRSASGSPRLPTPLTSVPRVLKKGSIPKPIASNSRNTSALGETEPPQDKRSAHIDDTPTALHVAPGQTTSVSHPQPETETTQEHINPINNTSMKAGLADGGIPERTEPSTQRRRMNLGVKATVERAEGNSPSSSIRAGPSSSAASECQSPPRVRESSSAARAPRSESPLSHLRSISRTPEQPILNHSRSSSVISSVAPSTTGDLVEVAGRNMRLPNHARSSYTAPQCQFSSQHRESEEDRIRKMMIKSELGMVRPRRRKHPWSQEETERLVELFGQYGPSWALILQKDKETGRVFAPCRTNVDLKDRVRNIKTDMLRKQAPIPPEFSNIYLGDKEIRTITHAWRRMEL